MMGDVIAKNVDAVIGSTVAQDDGIKPGTDHTHLSSLLPSLLSPSYPLRSKPFPPPSCTIHSHRMQCTSFASWNARRHVDSGTRGVHFFFSVFFFFDTLEFFLMICFFLLLKWTFCRDLGQHNRSVRDTHPVPSVDCDVPHSLKLSFCQITQIALLHMFLKKCTPCAVHEEGRPIRGPLCGAQKVINLRSTYSLCARLTPRCSSQKPWIATAFASRSSTWAKPIPTVTKAT